MNDQIIIKKLEELISEGNNLATVLQMSDDDNVYWNKEYYQKSAKWEGSSLNLLKLRFGVRSDYYKQFFGAINRTYPDKYGQKSDIQYVKENINVANGVLEYVYDALKLGLTDDLFYKKEILILSDLLDQAYEFLDSGLELASAIYGRIVLETTIKEYTSKNNVKDVEGLKFDQLIIKLRKSGIIQQPFEISLRANYKIGSWAAHGDEEFEKLPSNEIKEFLNFVRDKVLTLK